MVVGIVDGASFPGWNLSLPPALPHDQVAASRSPTRRLAAPLMGYLEPLALLGELLELGDDEAEALSRLLAQQPDLVPDRHIESGGPG